MIDSVEAMIDSSDNFEALLQGVLAERSAAHTRPAGLEQRLLAQLMQAAEEHETAPVPAAPRFGFAESVRTKRSRASFWTALLAHACALLLVALISVQHHMVVTEKYHLRQAVTLAPPPPVLPRAQRIGGGGGHHDLAPVTEGHLPRLAQQQMMAPKAPPTQAAKITIEPTVVVQRELKMAESALPNLGMPNSSLKGYTLGNGVGAGMGSGNGAGIGPGSGGNTGGGVMHIGGSVKAPVVLNQVEPEYSEEARKAKFSGNVQVYLVVDQHGNPTHVRMVRGIGMGLDEKAVEAVKQYKFKPATQNGKPVEVEMYVDVGFQIF